MIPFDIVTSVFPVAIGTSLALESLFDWQSDNRWQAPYDPDREIPQRVSLSGYDSHLIDITTLCRNLINAVSPPKLLPKIPIDQLIERFLMELERIADIYQWYGVKDKLVLFHASFDTIKRHAADELRYRNTDKQKYESYLIETIVANALESNPSILKLDHRITGRSKYLLTSHRPYLYLSHRSVRRLDVLESHTGKLINPSKFGKYYHPIGRRRLDQFPFQERLLYIFGDKSMFKPDPISIRRMLYELGQSRWTPLSTTRRVDSDVTDYGTKDLIEWYYGKPMLLR